MELIEMMHQITQQAMKAMQPTELTIGTVTKAEPLEISIDPAMDVLKAPLLYRTSAVIERKIPVLAHSHVTDGFSHSHTLQGLGHTHTYSGGTTGASLAGAYPTSGELVGGFRSDGQLLDVACLEDQKPLPVKDGYIILNRGLQAGDKVLLLRVLQGNKYIILSRIFEEG